MIKRGYVYILTTVSNTAIYVGVTADLIRRIPEHKSKLNPTCFTATYNCNKLVYFKEYGSILEAIAEEKRIKGGSRKRKEALVKEMNPNWKDLWDELNPFA